MKRAGDDPEGTPDAKRLRVVPLPLLVAQWHLLPTEVQRVEILGRVTVWDLLRFAKVEQDAAPLVEEEFKHRNRAIFRNAMREGQPLLRIYADAERAYGTRVLPGRGDDIKYRMLYVYCIQRIASLCRADRLSVGSDMRGAARLWHDVSAPGGDYAGYLSDVFAIIGFGPHPVDTQIVIPRTRILAPTLYEAAEGLGCGWETLHTRIFTIALIALQDTVHAMYQYTALALTPHTHHHPWGIVVVLRNLVWTGPDNDLADGGTVEIQSAGRLLARGALFPTEERSPAGLVVRAVLREWDIDVEYEAVPDAEKLPQLETAETTLAGGPASAIQAPILMVQDIGGWDRWAPVRAYY